MTGFDHLLLHNFQLVHLNSGHIYLLYLFILKTEILNFSISVPLLLIITLATRFNKILITITALLLLSSYVSILVRRIDRFAEASVCGRLLFYWLLILIMARRHESLLLLGGIDLIRFICFCFGICRIIIRGKAV